MKTRLTMITFFALLAFNLKAQQTPIHGTWDYDDVLFNVKINCDCTDMEFQTVRNEIIDCEQKNLDYHLLDTYLEFNDDDKVKGILMGSKFDGAYTLNENVVVVHSDDLELIFHLLINEEERQLVFVTDRELLDGKQFYFNSEELGKVAYSLTNLKLVLNNLFDEEFENFLDERMEKSIDDEHQQDN